MRLAYKLLAVLTLVPALGYWRHRAGRRSGVTPRQHVNRCLNEVAALTDNPALFVGAGEKPRRAL